MRAITRRGATIYRPGTDGETAFNFLIYRMPHRQHDWSRYLNQLGCRSQPGHLNSCSVWQPRHFGQPVPSEFPFFGQAGKQRLQLLDATSEHGRIVDSKACCVAGNGELENCLFRWKAIVINGNRVPACPMAHDITEPRRMRTETTREPQFAQEPSYGNILARHGRDTGFWILARRMCAETAEVRPFPDLSARIEVS